MAKTSKNKGFFCGCGSGLEAGLCCQPLLSGKQVAGSAEQLMRSRYSAYVTGDIEYIRRTWHPDTVPADIDASAEIHWTGLRVIRHRQRGDNESEVEFIASYVSGGAVAQMHELSRFVRQDNVWLYVDGEQLEPLQARAMATPGRNDPCYCGSGRKYKKCCAQTGHSR